MESKVFNELPFSELQEFHTPHGSISSPPILVSLLLDPIVLRVELRVTVEARVEVPLNIPVAG